MTIRQVAELETMVINISGWNSILCKNCSLTHAHLEEVTLMWDFNFDKLPSIGKKLEVLQCCKVEGLAGNNGGWASKGENVDGTKGRENNEPAA